MPDTTTRRGSRRRPEVDAAIAEAVKRLRSAGKPLTKAGLAREAGVRPKAIETRWREIVDPEPASASVPPARRAFRKPPPPRQPPPMDRHRLAGLLDDALDPTVSPTDALAALHAARRVLDRLRMSIRDVLLVEWHEDREEERADARNIRRRAGAVMASPAFGLLTAWQKGFVFSLTEWTASVSQRQREVLSEIEERVAAADAAGAAVANLTGGDP